MLFAYSVMLGTLLSLGCTSPTPAGGRDPQLVVIDTDPGVDDMLALLVVLGDPNTRVLAITCVRGNVLSGQAVINVFKILQLAKRYDVPVYSGNDYGLVEQVPGDGYFGADGLLNATFPQPPNDIKVEKEHAASFMARVVREHPGKINFLALGPLTNFALALHINPDFLLEARRVVILGGSVTGVGNVAPGLEFNFYADAAAARVVLDLAASSGTVLTIVPIETIISQDLNYEWRWNTVSKLNTSVVRVLDEAEHKLQKKFNLTAYHPYDVFAAADLLSENVATDTQNVYGFVENEGLRLRGSLTVDFDNILKKPANLEVVMAVNADVLRNVIVDNLKNLK